MVELEKTTSRIALIFLMAVGFPVLSLRADDGNFKSTRETLTLRTSLDRAFRSNPQLLEAEKELTIAKAHAREAASLFFPRVNLNYNFIRYRNETLGLTAPELGATVVEPRFGTVPQDAQSALTDYIHYARIGFVQPLFTGGKLDATYRLSQAKIKRAESDYETLRRAVEFETTKSFFVLLANREKENRLKDASGQVSRLSQTGLSRFVQLALDRKRAEFRKRLAQLGEEMHEAKMNYLQAMGVELFNDVEMEGTLEIPTMLPDLQKIIAWAKQNRSDIRQTEIQVEVDQLAVNLSMAERYPVFLLGGAYEVRDNNFPMDNQNWNTGISMNIPIFDGLSSLYRIRASKARAEQGRLRKVQLEDQVEREVRGAYQDFVYWRDELGQRTSELDKLEKDRAVILNSLDALLKVNYLGWRLDAQLDVVEALAQLNISKAALEKAIGHSLNTP